MAKYEELNGRKEQPRFTAQDARNEFLHGVSTVTPGWKTEEKSKPNLRFTGEKRPGDSTIELKPELSVKDGKDKQEVAPKSTIALEKPVQPSRKAA